MSSPHSFSINKIRKSRFFIIGLLLIAVVFFVAYWGVPKWQEYKTASAHTEASQVQATALTWSPTNVDSSVDTKGVETSIALDSSNNPSIVYQDQTNTALRYAFCSISTNCDAPGDWTSYQIDSNANEYLSIAIDSSNNKHISYSDSGTDEVRYAFCASASGCDAPGDWTTVSVDDGGGQRGGLQ